MLKDGLLPQNIMKLLAKIMKADLAKTIDEQDEIILSADADWALLSETLADGSTRRTAINPPFEDADVEIRRANEQGVCVPCSYRITSAKK